MSAIADMTINDGATTPVAHVFKAIQANPAPLWRDSVAALALIGQNTVEISSVKEDRKLGLWRVRGSIVCPALELITGNNSSGYTAQPKVGYVNKVNFEFFLPVRGTTQQRKDLRTFMINALSNAQLVDLIDNLIIPT